MYINPFVGGVLATIMTEIIIVIVAAVAANINDKKK